MDEEISRHGELDYIAVGLGRVAAGHSGDRSPHCYVDVKSQLRFAERFLIYLVYRFLFFSFSFLFFDI